MKKAMIIAVLFPMALLLGGGGPGAADKPIVFKNVTLVPMTGNRTIPGRAVVVTDGRISKIGPSRSVRVPAGAVVIDGSGKYLMPGLADMHVHSGAREWETPDLNLFLANGVTTVRDLTQGGMIDSIKRLAADIGAKIRLGPAMLTAWTIWGWESQAAATVPLVKAHGYDCLKINSYFTRDEFSRTVKAAKAAGLYTIGHVPQPLSMEDLVASGLDELSHVELLPIMLVDDPAIESAPKDKWDEAMLEHMFGRLTPAHEDRSGKALGEVKAQLGAMIAKLAGTGVAVTTTLAVDQAIALIYNDLSRIVRRPDSRYLPPRFWDLLMKGQEKNAYFRGREWAAQLFYDLIVFSLGEIRKNGIPIVAGTDAGPFFMGIVPGSSLQIELQLLVEHGCSPYEALAAATRDASKVAARMTGRDEFGTVEEGKRADLLLVDGDPLQDIAAAQKISGVMIAGIWLPRPELERLLRVKRTMGLTLLRDTLRKTGSVDAALAEYRRLCRENRSNDYYLAESTLTSLGYDLLKQDRFDEAIRIFMLNCREYPFSANVYDSLAEAYLKSGDKASAIETYRKALTMDPSYESSLKALQGLEK